MSNEIKQRKKSSVSSGYAKEPQKTTEARGPKSDVKESPEPRSGKAGGADARMMLSLLSIAASLTLTWLVFQQSAKLSDVEEKYHLLQEKNGVVQGLEKKVNLISKELDSSEEILQKAAASVSVVTQFEEEVSSLRSIINTIQNNEKKVSKKLQQINNLFQNVTDVWEKSLGNIEMDIKNLKSETKSAHSNVTLRINDAEQRLKSLLEKLEDLEDSTVRNANTLKRQEDEDAEVLEKQMNWNKKEIEKLEGDQQALIAKSTELIQKITEYESKLEEYKEHLPTIENGVHSIFKVSTELVSTEKKIEDLTVKLFNMEDVMLKTVSEILEIQKNLEELQFTKTAK
uniref:IKBKB interacting protein n=1 Tax=Latimeria chalumnae TaxID=7897 RepID=H3BCA8_LATCH